MYAMDEVDTHDFIENNFVGFTMKCFFHFFNENRYTFKILIVGHFFIYILND